MSNTVHKKADLKEVVTCLRGLDKNYTLLFGYNGTGKTRLSVEFKDMGKEKNEEGEVNKGDTLYFNAYTEDLFYWDNDIEFEKEKVLIINKDSKFFDGLVYKDKQIQIQTQNIENLIRPILNRYADFDFIIDYNYRKKNENGEEEGDVYWAVKFIREELVNGKAENIEYVKISRGEESLFIWCFFVAIVQLVFDEEERKYNWVKYIFIDDPVSSLDDSNIVAIASHLAHLIINHKKKNEPHIRFIISTHHALFYNVLWNEFDRNKRSEFQPYFLAKNKETGEYSLKYTRETPFFHHVALLKELKRIANTGKLYSYHFSLLRNILEKTATFHGFNKFDACINKDKKNDPDGIIFARLINVLSHGNYSMFEPIEMVDENKKYFKQILNNFMSNYRFNPELFYDELTEK